MATYLETQRPLRDALEEYQSTATLFVILAEICGWFIISIAAACIPGAAYEQYGFPVHWYGERQITGGEVVRVILMSGIIAIPGLVLAVGSSLDRYRYLIAERQKYDRWEPKRRELREQRRQQSNGHDVTIIGHDEFRTAVLAVLDELRSKSRHRYDEALKAMPRLRFDSEIGSRAWAVSDGRFSIDSANPHFRWVYLHEVGHYFRGSSEEGANAYANEVCTELDCA